MLDCIKNLKRHPPRRAVSDNHPLKYFYFSKSSNNPNIGSLYNRPARATRQIPAISKNIDPKKINPLNLER